MFQVLCHSRFIFITASLRIRIFENWTWTSWTIGRNNSEAQIVRYLKFTTISVLRERSSNGRRWCLLGVCHGRYSIAGWLASDVCKSASHSCAPYYVVGSPWPLLSLTFSRNKMHGVVETPSGTTSLNKLLRTSFRDTNAADIACYNLLYFWRDAYVELTLTQDELTPALLCTNDMRSLTIFIASRSLSNCKVIFYF